MIDEKLERILNTGDLVILTRGKAYHLYDAAGQTPVNITKIIVTAEKGNAVQSSGLAAMGLRHSCCADHFNLAPDGKKCSWPCFLKFFMMAYEKGVSKASLEPILDMIATEALKQHTGASLVLDRLVEFLFVHILRSWVNSPKGKKEANWMNALRDDRIAAAIGILRSQPKRPWTVERLSACVNLSRSPFALRFKQKVGQSPMTYLRQLRLDLATELMTAGNWKLKEIAAQVGYESETSFGKAFKSVFGISPGTWQTSNMLKAGIQNNLVLGQRRRLTN